MEEKYLNENSAGARGRGAGGQSPSARVRGERQPGRHNDMQPDRRRDGELQFGSYTRASTLGVRLRDRPRSEKRNFGMAGDRRGVSRSGRPRPWIQQAGTRGWRAQTAIDPVARAENDQAKSNARLRGMRRTRRLLPGSAKRGQVAGKRGHQDRVGCQTPADSDGGEIARGRTRKEDLSIGARSRRSGVFGDAQHASR